MCINRVRYYNKLYNCVSENIFDVFYYKSRCWNLSVNRIQQTRNQPEYRYMGIFIYLYIYICIESCNLKNKGHLEIENQNMNFKTSDI